MNMHRFIYNNPDVKERRKSLRVNQTDAEKLLWRYLRNSQIGYRFHRQYGVGCYVLDFY